MTLFSRAVLIAAIILLTACAGGRYHRQGLTEIANGKQQEGLSNLEHAVKAEPGNAQFRIDLLQQKAQYITSLLSVAESDRLAGKWEASAAQYAQVLKLEPSNKRALAGLDAVARDRRHAPLIDLAKEALKKGDMDQTALLLKPVFSENPANPGAIAVQKQIEELRAKEQVTEPTLRTGQRKPVSLEFRDANLKMVFEALARTTGVNFILDKDVRPDLKTTVFLKQSSLEDAIELILQTNRLEKKVLNPNTILIYPNTPEKLKDYQELVVKGFYLANADAKRTEAMIKGLIKTKDVFVDEKLNLVVIRDTPDAVKLAEKLIAMHDMHEPEVMLEVEVLEVKRSRLLELGVQWPSQLTLAPLAASGVSNLASLKNLNSDRIGVTLPSATVNLRREIGDANILANPRIRARNREKAKIMIGDKVPVITTTTSANGFVSENAQYLDVGIKLDVEPDIHLQDEVAIKIGLEVSSLVREVRTPSGALAYQIGSRSASTVLRLKDGETQVLAGLISDEDRTSANRVPGLGDVPMVGRLFSSQKDNREKTEIVLSITPRLIRNINRPDVSTSEFWSGTESALRTKPLALQVMAETDNTTRKQLNSPVPTLPTQDDVAAGMEPTAISLAWQAPSQVKAGEQFKVALRMKADGGLSSLPFQLAFDTNSFQVVGVAEGDYFKQNGGDSNISTNVDPAAGKVFGTVVRSGMKGAYGDESVAIVTFKALSGKPQGAISLLAATPISPSGKTVSPTLPAPLSITIAN